MAELRFFRRSKFNYAPASYAANSTDSILSASIGDLVGAAFCNVRVVFNGTNVNHSSALGDDGDVDRFMTTTNVGDTATGLKRGTGAGLTETLGYLYTTANTIDVTFVADTAGDGTTGNIDWWVYIAKINP